MPPGLLDSQLLDLEPLGPEEPGITLRGDLDLAEQVSAVMATVWDDSG